MKPNDSKAAVPWYVQGTASILEHLDVRPEQGLSDAEVQARLETYGSNELEETGLKSPWLILWEQFTGFLVLVLIVAAIISLVLGEVIDAVAILVIVVLNAIFGFVQEYRAERAIAALKQMAAPTVRVRRNGGVHDVEARQLVPGDIVLLEAGNIVPADARLVDAVNLRIQESSLTGESQAVDKTTEALSGEDIPLGDRHNMAFMGTVVTYGRGTAAVVDTGMRTELGRIAQLIQGVETEQTPLQKRMAGLGRTLAIAAIGIVALVFVLGLFRGEDPRELFLTSVAMAVATVPEGLLAVVTVALALGAQRMLKRQALIRKLPAVETLGSITVICSDKTGTLTENRMTVRILDVAGESAQIDEILNRGVPVLPGADSGLEPQCPAHAVLLTGGALANDALITTDDENPTRKRAIGDPTEGALLIAAAHFGLWKPHLEESFPRVAEVPFSSERKRMTTVHQLSGQRALSAEHEYVRSLVNGTGQQYVAFTKGAVDGLLRISSRVWNDREVVPLTDEWANRILDANESLASEGMRILGVAFKPLDAPPSGSPEQEVENDLIFVGMMAMIDPPRPEVKTAVETCKTAGIRPVMITGDHPATALHIARQLGIATDGEVLTGQELERLSTEELEGLVERVSVYARVSPEHKLKIVQALQDRGHIAAMTGDGVNDAPALRKSDIGVAMGITGTDVSKEAANMVILDDNFATIVRAVEEGRVIYDNVRKFVKYTMTSNAGEILVMLLGPFLGMPLPLSALQILWVNLVTDGLPGLALGVEPAEPNVMRRPPYPPNETFLGRGLVQRIIVYGLLMGLVSIASGYFQWLGGNPEWQTMIFTTLTLSQMGNALAIRSDEQSLFRVGLSSNKAMLGAVLLTLVLQLAVIYLAPLQTVFDTRALTWQELLFCLAISTVVFWAVEIEKWWRRRYGDARLGLPG